MVETRGWRSPLERISIHGPLEVGVGEIGRSCWLPAQGRTYQRRSVFVPIPFTL